MMTSPMRCHDDDVIIFSWGEKEIIPVGSGWVEGRVVQCIKGVPRFITISELQVHLSLFWLPLPAIFMLVWAYFPIPSTQINLWHLTVCDSHGFLCTDMCTIYFNFLCHQK